MLLLIRDLGGIAILFIMPLLLLIVITLVQDSTFKTISDIKIPVLLVDNDKGEVSKNIIENLSESNSFEILQKSSEEEAKEAVFSGKYQLAIVIPENLSASLQKKVDQNVEGILSKFGLEEDTLAVAKEAIPQKEVRLYFDPATQVSFKSSVKNGIDKMISEIETQSIYKAFQTELGEDDSESIFETESFIAFKEILPTKNNEEIIPNSGVDAVCHFFHHCSAFNQSFKGKKSRHFCPFAHHSGELCYRFGRKNNRLSRGLSRSIYVDAARGNFSFSRHRPPGS